VALDARAVNLSTTIMQTFSRHLRAGVFALSAALALTLPSTSLAAQQGIPVAKGEAPTAATLTSDALRQLRWLEGSWRGSGAGQAPFFERYSFPNETTMLVESFSDSTFTRVTETSRYVLRDGRLANDGNMRWVAARLDDTSAFFIPLERANNSFLWRRGTSSDEWTAVIMWRSADGPRERVYTMRRVRVPSKL
jgi:hypothetical protein